jgi:hypothetical protein
MNIFVTDECPKLSAQALDDRRVNKMIIESLQMMAYAIAAHSSSSELNDLLPRTKDGYPYKVGGPHKKHPCSVWAGKTRGNYKWLLLHTVELIRQKEIRYPNGKTTESYRQAVIRCFKSRFKIPNKPLEAFQNSSEHKNIGSTIFAYRLTMIRKWENAKKKDTLKCLFKMMSRFGLAPKIGNGALPTWKNYQEPSWYGFLKNRTNWSD